MRRPLLIALAAVAAAAAAVPAFAASLGVSSSRLTEWDAPFCPSITLNAVRDAWIDQASPAGNFGTDQILKVRSQSGSANFRAILAFNIPAPAAGCTLTGATLRLYAASAASGRTLQVHRVAAAWAEGTVRWDNQPATTGSPVTTTSGSGYRTWNVLSLIDGTPHHGFTVRDAAENGSGSEQQFHARDKTPDVPQLVLSYG